MNFRFKDEVKATISVIGTSEINDTTRKIVTKLGRLLAENNYAIVCGGLSGVMEAICQGAKEVGGLTIGIIPFNDKSEVKKGDKSPKSSCDILPSSVIIAIADLVFSI